MESIERKSMHDLRIMKRYGMFTLSLLEKKKKHPTLGKNSKVGIPFLLSLNSKIFIIWGSVL